MVWYAPLALVIAPAEKPVPVTVMVAFATGCRLESNTVPEIEPSRAIERGATATLPFAVTPLHATVEVTPYINEARKTKLPGATSSEYAPFESVTAAALTNAPDNACTTAPGIGPPLPLTMPWHSPVVAPMTMVTLVSAPATTAAFMVTVEKPAALVMRVYVVPAARFGTRKSPSAPGFASVVTDVWPTTVTVALATGSPLASTTCPTNPPTLALRRLPTEIAR